MCEVYDNRDLQTCPRVFDLRLCPGRSARRCCDTVELFVDCERVTVSHLLAGKIQTYIS